MTLGPMRCAKVERKNFENMCTTNKINKEKIKLKKLRLEKISPTFHFVRQSLSQTDCQVRYLSDRPPGEISASQTECQDKCQSSVVQSDRLPRQTTDKQPFSQLVSQTMQTDIG
jgi:hypothetical protein